MSCPAHCCREIELPLLFLIFPEKMSPEDRKLLVVHGLDDLTVGELRAGATYERAQDTVVRFKHVCLQLTAENRCALYGTPERPQACGTFDCATRTDCTNPPAGSVASPVTVVRTPGRSPGRVK